MVGAQGNQLLSHQHDVWLELLVYCRKPMLGDDEKSSLVKDAGASDRLNDSSDVAIFAFHRFDGSRRSRPIPVVGVIQFHKMYQHEIGPVGLDYVFADDRSELVSLHYVSFES